MSIVWVGRNGIPVQFCVSPSDPREVSLVARLLIKGPFTEDREWTFGTTKIIDEPTLQTEACADIPFDASVNPSVKTILVAAAALAAHEVPISCKVSQNGAILPAFDENNKIINHDGGGVFGPILLMTATQPADGEKPDIAMTSVKLS